MKYIPYKVKICVPVKEDLRRILKCYGQLVVFPVDSKKFTKTIFEKIKNYYSNIFYSTKFNSISWEIIEISNSGFELILSKKTSLSDSIYYYYDNLCTSIVFIRHPEISDDLSIFIENTKLLDIIADSGYISENKVHGSFCCRYDEPVETFYGNTTLEIENPSNKEQQREKDTGKLLYEFKKTIKWIPGNIYVLKSGVKVLYLGSIDNCLGIKEKINKKYNITKGSNIFCEVDDYNMFISDSKRESSYYLFINFDDFVDILRQEGVNLEDYFKTPIDLTAFLNILSGFLENYNNLFSTLMYYDKFPLGVKIETLINCPEKTSNLFKKFFINLFGIKNITAKSALASFIDYNDLPDSSKKEYDKLYKQKLLTFYTPGVEKTTPENFYKGLLDPGIGYTYNYLRTCRNILFTIGKDNFIKYLK